jgi:transposase
MFGYQRVKTDARDSRNLAELLRMGRLPEAWLAPPEVRELRELVRYRAKLVALRSGLKAQVHAVLAKQGVRVPMSDLFGVAGTRLLDELRLERAYALRVASLRKLLAVYDQEITLLGREIATALADDAGYLAIQAIPGVGPVLAAVEATQRLPGASKQAADFHRIADRRGKGIGRVAAARKLLTLVYYGLRDGQVRCLATASTEAM